MQAHNYRKLSMKKSKVHTVRFRPCDFLVNPEKFGKKMMARPVDADRLRTLRAEFALNTERVAESYIPGRISALLGELSNDLPTATRLNLRSNINTVIARMAALREVASAELDAILAPLVGVE
jgi:hypothetical protein